VSAELAGRNLKLLREFSLVIRGDKFRFRQDDTDPEKPFRLDPSARPKTIDLGEGPRASLAIYALDGDTLRLCLGNAGAPRPTGFDGPQQRKTLLLLLKREKSGPAPGGAGRTK
jgi:uncharacterized protein (TIGR03067 family)